MLKTIKTVVPIVLAVAAGIAHSDVTPTTLKDMYDTNTLYTASQVDQLIQGGGGGGSIELTPIYSQTPTFSEWTYSGIPDGWVVEIPPRIETDPEILQYYNWSMSLFDGELSQYLYSTSAVDSNEVVFDIPGGGTVTATRTRTDIIGYTLGNQTTKPLAAADPLLFAQYYPNGSVKSAAEFTAGIKYNFATNGTGRTAMVKPFCNTGDSENDNSGLEGRVVIPPFVDAQGNGYISDDGTRYKVVGVSAYTRDDTNENLTAIVAPTTVTTIGDDVFSYCTSLTSVSLPAATNIGGSAFFHCTLLASVSLPAAQSIGDGAFASCTSLASVSLPAATDIGAATFSGCFALTSVSLPAATTIGGEAFINCTSLTSVDFGGTPRSSVPTLGTNAFYNVPTTCKIIVPYTQYDAWKAVSDWSALQQKFVRHAEKADKPATFTAGNLAEFDSDGNLVDSHKKPSDFANATNVYTKAETEAKIVELAPAPGDYANVSNKAMNALSRAEAKAGFTEWTVTPPTYNGSKLTVYWNEEQHFWELHNESGINVVTPLTDQSGYETDIGWNDGEPLVFTATRTRLPTMADLDGKASTNDVTLTPIYSGTPTLSEWTFSNVSTGVSSISQPVYHNGGSPRWSVTFRHSEASSILTAYNYSKGQDATEVGFIYYDEDFDLHFTATRTRTDIIGYTLGSNTNQVLVSTNLVNERLYYAEYFCPPWITNEVYKGSATETNLYRVSYAGRIYRRSFTTNEVAVVPPMEDSRWIDITDTFLRQNPNCRAEGFGTSALGKYTHAEGYRTRAATDVSIGSTGAHAEGSKTEALGDASHAEGRTTKADMHAAHAEGLSSHANSQYAHAEGELTTTYGRAAHAEGYGSVAGVVTDRDGTTTNVSAYAHAEGMKTRAIGLGTHAEGTNTVASAVAAHAEGNGAQALGPFSHAEGGIRGNKKSIAYGQSAHAEGEGAGAFGKGSHAEGGSTVATNSYAHAEGLETIAAGINAHAEGKWTQARKDNTHAEGVYTIADHKGVHTDGRYAMSAHENSYIWSGVNLTSAADQTNTVKYYKSNGVGTYNINPVGGASGFYIGSTNIATMLNLTPIYSQTPTFSKWTILQDGADITSEVPQPQYTTLGYWECTIVVGGTWNFMSVYGPEDAVSLSWSDFGISYTATRERTDIIGYTLGTQTHKMLQPAEPLLLAQYYPEGNVKSATEFTSDIKYDFATNGTERTAMVKPFCNTGTDEDDNSGLSGRVVIPPFVDASGNWYISDDGTRYKVVGVSGDDGSTLVNTNLTAIVAPTTVMNIGDGAFSDCDVLTTVSLPVATGIGDGAFAYCDALTTVSIPAATGIGDGAFHTCTNLVSVSFPAATNIGVVAFFGCTTLVSVSLPAAMHIRDGAFFGCSSLSSVDFGDAPREEVPSLGGSAFDGHPETCKIIVPDAQYDKWKAASGWNALLLEFVRHSEWEYARKYDIQREVSDRPTMSQVMSLDMSYRHFSEVTNINQSVQVITNAPNGTISIEVPIGDDATKDWLVYVFINTNAVLSLPQSNLWYSAKSSYTNEIPANIMTALYFSQIGSNAYTFARQQMTPALVGTQNKDYAKVIDNGAKLEYAPSVMAPILDFPTEAEYNSKGYYFVDLSPSNTALQVTNMIYFVTNNSVRTYIDAEYFYADPVAVNDSESEGGEDEPTNENELLSLGNPTRARSLDVWEDLPPIESWDRIRLQSGQTLSEFIEESIRKAQQQKQQK